jgi:hypothetical protein
MNVSQREQIDQLREQEYPASQQVFHFTGGGTVAYVLVVLIFSATIMVLASRNPATAGMGMIGTPIFFLVAATLGVMGTNGGLERCFCERQRQVTIRQQNDRLYALQIEAGEHRGRYVVEQPTAVPALSAGGPQSPYGDPAFVPAVPPVSRNRRAMAATWVAQLFDEHTGKPLSKRITQYKQQIQLRNPEPDVMEFLGAIGLVTWDEGNHPYWVPDLTTSSLAGAIEIIKRSGRPPIPEGGAGRVGEGGVA